MTAPDPKTSTTTLPPPPDQDLLLLRLGGLGRPYAVCTCNALFVGNDDETAEQIYAMHNCPLAPFDSPRQPAQSWWEKLLRTDLIVCAAIVLVVIFGSPTILELFK